MNEYAVLWDWLSFGVRWLHVVTAIAWIGSSFYFIALDLGLQKAPQSMPAEEARATLNTQSRQWALHARAALILAYQATR